MIARDDVVLIKINSQWAERGGTNTDLLKSLIQHIVSHPAGFSGEVIIADNGQGMFGSERRGGNLDWAQANSKDRTQSAQDVSDYFEGQGQKVSGVLFDNFTRIRVREFSDGDNDNGFIIEETPKQPSGLVVSYAKFTTKFATKVSFKLGVYDAGAGAYNSGRLKVINMPVLKNHGQYQVTGAVKSYMGIPSNALTSMSPHNSVGRGGMGALMAGTRFPTLNILDMIYIAVSAGPSSPYNRAVQKNMIAASTDPVALDYWASRNVLLPAAEAARYARASSMDAEATDPGTFGYWLRLSAQELTKTGIPVTMENSRIKANVIR
jgi:hypothetical protein